MQAQNDEEENPIRDVCIVGAGPAGATCAYYLAKMGRSVLLLDKQRFPHDKVCGDVIAPLAQKHLQEMGVLEQIIYAKEGRWGILGGFVSPSGDSFIGKLTTGERLLSVQRIILDEKVAYAAENAGATLLDGFEVKTVSFDQESELWTITLTTCDIDGSNYSFRARALVAADGANSDIARQLGVVTTPPDTYCSRSFAKAGTHSFPNADHVCFYAERLLPGYFVVFHELEGFLNLCCYFIPCGGKWAGASPQQLHAVYEDYLQNDPFIKQALGPDVAITPSKFAPMRVGGVPKSYGHHFLVIGDAAGQVDPLTGGGIHYGMEAGQIAAETLIEGFAEGDLSESKMKLYHRRWKKAFGRDFWLAYQIVHLLYRYPILLDAAAEVIKRKGEAFVGAWATAMMGGRSKLWFFYPTCSCPILLEAVRLRWRRWREKK
jgi:geranylgeranyl reductase family protein